MRRLQLSNTIMDQLQRRPCREVSVLQASMTEARGCASRTQPVSDGGWEIILWTLKSSTSRSRKMRPPRKITTELQMQMLTLTSFFVTSNSCRRVNSVSYSLSHTHSMKPSVKSKRRHGPTLVATVKCPSLKHTMLKQLLRSCVRSFSLTTPLLISQACKVHTSVANGLAPGHDSQLELAKRHLLHRLCGTWMSSSK